MPKLLFTAFSLPTPLCRVQGASRRPWKERREPKGDSCTYPTGGSWGSTVLEKQASPPKACPKICTFLGNTNTHLGNPGKAELLLVLAAQALQLELIFLPLSVFPRVASGTQPRAPYKHELPAASSRASTPACGLGSQTRLLAAREQSPVPTGGSPEHLQALSSVHPALLMPTQNALGTAEHKLASSGLSRPQTQAGAGRRSS